MPKRFLLPLLRLLPCAPFAWIFVLATGCGHSPGVTVSTSAPPVAVAEIRPASVAPEAALTQFHQTIGPILEQRCYACHGDGEKKGGLAFDELKTKEQILQNPALWLKVLRNTRSHIMPPAEKAPPTAVEQAALESWIKTAAFGLDPARPDPGRVTIRRLNRTEYRNTIRDLIGYDFDAEQVLPPDDVGYGFDNIGDVLSFSPIRMEKFLTAAQSVIEHGVPQSNKSIGTQLVLAKDFLPAESGLTNPDGFTPKNGEHLSFYEYVEVGHTYQAKKAGDYRIIVSAKIDGEAQPVDPQVAKVTYKSDGKAIRQFEYPWDDALYSVEDKIVHWEPGEHKVSFAIEPTKPELQPLRTKMEYRLIFVTVEGPLAQKDWELPANYHRFYTRDLPPEDAVARRAYAREVLEKFATRAYRRPVAAETLDRLVAIAEQTYTAPNTTFEKGVAQAMFAVLSSPHFLFRIEEAAPTVTARDPFPQVDEYTLASRLSYFLWSSMPDDDLFALAAKGELRKNLAAQVKRMVADPKAQALIENFPGQWLQSRSVIDIPINTADVLAAEQPLPAPSTVLADVTVPLPADPAAVAGGAAAGGFAGRGGRGVGAVPGAPAAFAPPDPSAAAFGGLPPGTPSAAGAPVVAQGALDPAAFANGAGLGRGAGARGAAGRGARGNGANGAAFAGAGRGGRGGGRGGRGAAAPAGLELTPEVRAAMKQETESYFGHIVHDDRSVLELISSDYIFVNDQLAPVYGLTGVTGPEMRQVTLPLDNPRGGVLTMGSILTVTSNPTRTSPVKRGKWILENILGSPSAPPPPNVPALESAQDKVGERKPTQRELVALHRSDPLCASCHARMDPLGFALENFNAFGRQRAQEFGQPIDPSGELATGEKISGIKDLKQVIVTQHRAEFYRTITEKLLTYALGRGVEYYDVPTVDTIVARMEKEEGRFSALLMGIVESPAFQQRRATSTNPLNPEAKPALLADNPSRP